MKEIYDLESFIFTILDEIKMARDLGADYKLHLEPSMVEKIAEAYEETKWIEIY